MQGALYAKVDNPVCVDFWKSYVDATGKNFSDGVDKKEQVEFYRFVCSYEVMFDFNASTWNLLNTLISNDDQLMLFSEQLEQGVYVVHAGQQLRNDGSQGRSTDDLRWL